MSVVDRMTTALTELQRRTNGRRQPKAFYLIEGDWAEFTATSPPTVESMWGNNPPMKVTDPAFSGIPVRLSTGQVSRLYDHVSAGRAI